jgi:outer membrane protein TolC
MGRLPDGGDLVDDILPSIELLSEISSPVDLFDNRPDLRAGFLALNTADQNVAAAVAERLPQLSMGLSYGKSRQSFSTLETETVFSFTSTMLAPLFDAGRLKATVSQKKAEASELLAILEQAVLVAVREVEDALALELSLFEKQHFLRKEISIARETVNKARLRYVNGKESYLTVLSSLEDLQNLQVEEIEIQQELLINRCRLLKALGVKWSY